MNLYFSILTSAFTALMLYGCDKEEIVENNNFNAADNYNRSVHVEVSHIYDLANGLDSMVNNASVLLFEDRDVFITYGYADNYRITDSTGIVNFELLDKEYYWVRIIHPDLGELIDSVSTPPNTNSFLFIDFL